MNVLKATNDKIIAIVPPKPPEPAELQDGGIIIPEAAKEAIRKRFQESPMQNLLIVSVGPDCKTARPGLRVIVNKHVYNDAPIEFEGVHYAVFSEISATAIVETREPTADEERKKSLLADNRPTIAEVKAAVGLDAKPKDDSSDLPTKAQTAVD